MKIEKYFEEVCRWGYPTKSIDEEAELDKRMDSLFRTRFTLSKLCEFFITKFKEFQVTKIEYNMGVLFYDGVFGDSFSLNQIGDLYTEMEDEDREGELIYPELTQFLDFFETRIEDEGNVMNRFYLTAIECINCKL